MIDAVVFDLDGTLVDSARDIAEAVGAALASVGRPPRSLEEVIGMIGHGARALLASALETDDDATIERARAVFMAHYRAHPATFSRPYPGVTELLAALGARGIGVAVATNKPREITRLLLDALGWGALVSVSADEAPARKPDPAVLRLALARIGVPAERAAYVGDMDVDVETARRAGARSIGVSWGFSPRACHAATPDAWVERPSELLAILEAWRKPRR